MPHRSCCADPSSSSSASSSACRSPPIAISPRSTSTTAFTSSPNKPSAREPRCSTETAVRMISMSGIPSVSSCCGGRASRRSGRVAIQVEGKEGGEERLAGQVVGPAVGGEDGAVHGGVCMLEPGWPRVVEVGERPLAQLDGIEAGRIEPAVAEADELAGGRRDRFPLLVAGAREREGLEAGGGGVAEAGLDLPELGARGAGPRLVNAGVQDAKRVVVVASENDEGMVRNPIGGEPREEPMLGRRWRDDAP